MIENYYADFVAGMTALKEKHPLDPDTASPLPGGHHPIDAFNIVVTLADEEIYPLFIGLAGVRSARELSIVRAMPQSWHRTTTSPGAL